MSNEMKKTKVATVGGIAAGSAATAGTYTAVATFGTASTGTAIGTLGGAAAKSATLAWFGGGAVAARWWHCAWNCGASDWRCGRGLHRIYWHHEISR